MYENGFAQGLKWATTESRTHDDLLKHCDLMRCMGCNPDYRTGFLYAALDVMPWPTK
jgi:hypothetical protein